MKGKIFCWKKLDQKCKTFDAANLSAGWLGLQTGGGAEEWGRGWAVLDTTSCQLTVWRGQVQPYILLLSAALCGG